MDKQLLDGLDCGVVPQGNHDRFLEVLAEIEAQKEKINWREIQERSGTENKEAALISTAVSISSAETSTALFRKRDDANQVLAALWISTILNKARLISLSKQAKRFTRLSVEDLRAIARLSVDPQSIAHIGDYLFEQFGIVLVVERSYSGMMLDGLVTRLNSGVPVIGLSVRYSRYDNFWFTLLHELAHVALHYELLGDVICDDLDEAPESQVEQEANRMATDSLVPRRIFSKSAVLRSRSDFDLDAMAREAEVHPIVAAGLVRHQLNNYRIFSGLVGSIDVRDFLRGMQ